MEEGGLKKGGWKMEEGSEKGGWKWRGIIDKLRSVLGEPSLIWIHGLRNISDRRNDAWWRRNMGRRTIPRNQNHVQKII